MPFIVFHEMPPLRLTKFFTLTFYFSKINFNIILLSVSGLSFLEIFSFRFSSIFLISLLIRRHGIATQRTELKIHRIPSPLY